MNNQAAQTMPELPDSQYRGGNDVFGKEFPLYTADQVHQYARDYAAMLAAARAASGAHPDALPDGNLSKSTVKRVTALAAASVSEDAAFESWFSGEQGKAYDGMWSFARAAWMKRAALEQALTQQRGAEDGRSTSYSREALEIQGARWRAVRRTVDHLSPGWDSGIVGAVDAASAAVRVLTAQATTPKPSADAVRELVERWRSNGHPYVSDCADELESLLSAANDHQQNAAQGGGD